MFQIVRTLIGQLAAKFEFLLFGKVHVRIEVL